ncbi:MAG: asparagine synthase (glutamine-hydrolyzing) [Burkholderiales bacterium]|nr:asparagine synthase (glutamine-hydrolyzing) [Burkholderiales bacterium]
MCGIAGYVDFAGHDRQAAAARVKRMTDAIVYRGPDAEGFYVDQHAALGHRRLAIIDVSSGHQPMAAADGAVQIVFNGEIYDFDVLRAELQSLGHVFHTRSDTEVILQAYLAWGEDCLARLNGMFAFAIWDRRTRTLLLARDRIGKKPLYYYRNGSRIGFASELKALRAGGFCNTEIDPVALDCYFTFGYVPSPRTIYRDVHKLPPASRLLVDAAGVREARYWRLSFAQQRQVRFDDAVDELETLLDSAVRGRMVSEVPLGAFLSGGLDSSLVVAAMSRLSERPVITHSIGFEEREFNELHVARATAEHLGTEHHEHMVTPQAVDVLPKIAHHFDEPLADSSAIPTWYVCQAARRSVTVALSGDGGDESFAGYTFRYTPHVVESRIRSRLPASLRTAAFGPLGHWWPGSARLPRPLRLKSIFENLASSDDGAFYRDLAWLREDVRAEVYAGDFMASLKGYTPREAVAPYYRGSDALDALGRAQDADIHFYMVDDVLVKVDRMSMAHSLEVRSPLLDYRILEFAARLPSELKLDRNTGKLPLRALARRRLPAQLLDMPKRGFSIPAARWLRAELRPMVEDLLFGDSRARVLDHLNRRELRRLWHEHLQGQRDHNVFIWGVMMLALWEHSTHVRTAGVAHA